MLAAGVRRARVWAFEPDPRTLLALRRNVELNQLHSRVELYEFAIGDVDGEAQFTSGWTRRTASRVHMTSTTKASRYVA